MVDSSQNRIYGLIQHFSSLVVRENTNVVSIKADGAADAVPARFVLRQNYPNPFNPKTAISYQLPAFSEVELSIFNILGQKVKTLVSKKQPAGNYKVEWDAAGFSSGIYFYVISTDNGFMQTRKLVLLK